MRGRVPRDVWFIAFIGALIYSLWQVGLLDPSRLGRFANLVPFIVQMIPPDVSLVPLILEATYETVLMAFTGTVIGGFLSLPLAMLSSRLLFPKHVTVPFRTLLAVIRTVPSLLWALIFVIIIGLGPPAGVMAISFYTVGYLGKLFYESFDSVSKEVLEGVGAVGASQLQLLRFAIVPETANYIISQLLFIFEYNVRASSIIGLVGAGGIGYLILALAQSLRYDGLLMCILVILAFVMGMDAISSKIRARFLR
ncbi:MAG: phosphonate ABC transporter, permease protein PhnE [Aigarchaeota archaeon]|nr:phosphonate ABC transporter, permease protein PhnE [Aigarchaeota archaeon]MDW8093220.1 phosphonate ABC transporter, permease protein PhnE [Nitrososphaerota archaeon]